MANPDHLAILKQGIKPWNKWREECPGIRPDFAQANLSGADLSEAVLRGVSFLLADVSRANLTNTSLTGATFIEANLSEARLVGADVFWTQFSDSKLDHTDFSDCGLSDAVFANVDLSTAKGLDTVRHQGPSEVGLNTFFKSRGKIPEVFLRGCGVPEEFITYAASLAGKPIEFYSAFISYSNHDKGLAERLHADLQAKGVRCWFAPEDLKIGDRFRTEIDRAIRVHDKLLLLLSTASVASDWVEKEVETAFERERRDKRTALFPIRLDDTVMGVADGWAADVRRTRHIGDFTNWKDHDAYATAFARLLRDLKAK